MVVRWQLILLFFFSSYRKRSPTVVSIVLFHIKKLKLQIIEMIFLIKKHIIWSKKDDTLRPTLLWSLQAAYHVHTSLKGDYDVPKFAILWPFCCISSFCTLPIPTGRSLFMDYHKLKPSFPAGSQIFKQFHNSLS